MRPIISFLLILTALAVNARQISPEEAQSIASEFFNGSVPAKSAPKRTARFASKKQQEAEPYYIFNASDNNGFVIISGDTRAKKILGYSDSGSFDFDNMPPQLSALLEQYARQLTALPKTSLQDASWAAPKTRPEEGGVLLETANWGQGYPYNAQCPIIDGVQAPAGCVATAMAIVMKYHNWPEQGNGTHTNYFDRKLSWDYSKYCPNWEIISDNYETNDIANNQEQAISDLFLSAGIAIDTHYGVTESYAETTFLGNVMSSRFNFKPAYLLQRFNYSTEEWNNIIIEELINKRPILYCGSGSNGHEFVIDGYNIDNLFHINWGWDGMMNGFYDITNLKVAENDFSENHSMVIGIEPNLTNIRYSSFMINDGLGTYANQANEGLNFTVDKIESGEIFGVVLPALYLKDNIDFRAEVALAVIDSEDNIIEIVGTDGDDYDWVLDNGSAGLWTFSCGNYEMSAVAMTPSFGHLSIKSEIKPDYKLQIVGRDSPDSKWEYVSPSLSIPSSIDLNNEVRSEWVPVNIQYDNKYIDVFPESYFADCHKVLRGASSRWFVDFGAGKIELSSTSNLLIINPDIDDVGCKELCIGAGEEANHDSYYAEIIYTPQECTYYNRKEIPSNSVIVDGIVYELSCDNQSNPKAIIIGYTDECSESFVLKNSIFYNNKEYLINAVQAGVFVGNNTIKNIDLTKASFKSEPDEEGCCNIILKLLYGAFSYMNNIESITVGDNEPIEWDYHNNMFLFHRSSPIKYLYDCGQNVSTFLYSIYSLFGGCQDANIKPHWYITDPNIHTSNIIPLLNENPIHPIFYVPGASIGLAADSDDYTLKQMWDYKIDRKNGLLLIKPTIPEISIDNVYLNGEIVMPNNNYVYKFPNCANCDVVIEYTLNNSQKLSTYYTPDFNTYLPDSNLQPVTSIILNETYLTLNEGQTVLLTATVLPDDATDKTVTWSSSNDAVATVDADGKVTAVALGEATITATCGDVSASCAVQVVPTPVESIALSQTTVSLKVGESVSLTATVLPDDATDKTVTWNSSNEAIVTVDADGKVTALALGEAVITAKCGEVSASCAVKVVPTPVESITLSQTTASLKVGESVSLTATVLPDDATDKTVTWNSSNEAVATVDGSGLVSILAEGTCVITVTANDGSEVEAQCIITGLSGIDEIFADGEVTADVYTPGGVLLKKGCDKAQLYELSTGVYIIRYGKKVVKLIVK